MKKLIYVALMTFVMIGMTSCGKEKDLTGTKWLGLYSQTDEELGMTFSATIILEFTSETDGKISINAFGEMITSPFTYTYDGEGSGTITIVEGLDGEVADVTTVKFTIDGDTMTATDDEGVSVVFKKQ